MAHEPPLPALRCHAEFDAPVARGYCDDWVGWYRLGRTFVHLKQNPAPGVLADGKFADAAKDCPVSITDPVTEQQVCGLCGSDQIAPGYGIGTGYGCGSYNFCFGCDTFLDFHEDSE